MEKVRVDAELLGRLLCPAGTVMHFYMALERSDRVTLEAALEAMGSQAIYGLQRQAISERLRAMAGEVA